MNPKTIFLLNAALLFAALPVSAQGPPILGGSATPTPAANPITVVDSTPAVSPEGQVSPTTGVAPKPSVSPAPAAFEPLPILDASVILQPQFLHGPNFTVRTLVPTYFGSNHYIIDSDFGVFEADGNEMLMRRVAEINAIAEG
jgi:hypothetical protein